jgi:phosphohistidine phosphatase SixA
VSNGISSHVALRRRFLFLLPLLTALSNAHDQYLSGKHLVAALRTGGYVIVMRHASSPSTLPDAAQADADNVQLERQLDEAGRTSARAMGEALRLLHISVGQVLSSPTYRARETVRLAQLGQPKTSSQLGDAGHSMQADPSGKRAAWLRTKVAESPSVGTNTVIVTHFPNVSEAFGKDSADLAEGEALIFRPNGRGRMELVGRLRTGRGWPPFTSRILTRGRLAEPSRNPRNAERIRPPGLCPRAPNAWFQIQFRR